MSAVLHVEQARHARRGHETRRGVGGVSRPAVAALLSNRGASHRLLRLVGDRRWRINLSVPLVFEYEQTLQRVCTGGILTDGDIDSVMHFSVIHFLWANANLRPIFFLWRFLLPDPKDDFVLELAVESRADFLIPSTPEISWVRSASAFE